MTIPSDTTTADAATIAVNEPASKKQKLEETKNQFVQLNELTTIVADTGDIEAIAKFKPQDATTNPSLIYKAAIMPAYADLVDSALEYGKGDIETVMVSFCLGEFGESSPVNTEEVTRFDSK